MAMKAFNYVRLFRSQQTSLFFDSFQPLIASICAKNYATKNTEAYDNFLKIADQWDTTLKKQKTNRAMKVYIQRAKEYDDFMKQQQISFQIGKRHLANMMGEDPATFTQEDIDEAIAYLLPSGVYDKKARPIMKPPEEIFPPKKAAQFDESGRPFHFLFYTGRPNYHQVLFDITAQINELKKEYNNMLIKKAPIDPKSKFQMAGYQWVTKDEFENIVIETVLDREYSTFITNMTRLIDMPYSNKIKPFLQPYLKEMASQKKALEIPLPQQDENGRAFVTIHECIKKTARGHVTVRSPGTGLISINGQDITYFKDIQSREQVSQYS